MHALTWNDEGGAAQKQTFVGQVLDDNDATYGATPLHWAAWNRSVSAVRLLAENNADPDARDVAGLTPLVWAGEVGDDDVIPALHDVWPRLQ